jgi:hypothetical protein
VSGKNLFGGFEVGYTHYWEQKKKFSKKDWDLLKKAVLDIVGYCDELEITLKKEFNLDEYPVIDDEMIRFNGKGEEGHETFILTRERQELESWMLSKNPFAFCKTARKPYDLAVCLVLLSAFMIAPEVLEISSDGEWEGDWDQARQDYFELFGEEPICPFPFVEPRADIPTFHRHIDET